MAQDAGHEEIRALHEAVTAANKLASQLMAMGYRVNAQMLEMSGIGMHPAFHLTVEVLRPIPPGPACSHCHDGSLAPTDTVNDHCPRCGAFCMPF